MRKMLLPDVNVWLAVVFNAHMHHPAARAWLNGITDETAFFCRITQQGFLRLAVDGASVGPRFRCVPGQAAVSILDP